MPDIVFVTPNSPLPADRGGRLRAHYHWRSLSQIANCHTIVIGDRSDFAARQALRACGGEFWPRRRFDSRRYHQLLATGQESGAAGLWEIQGFPGALPDHVWASLKTGEALYRHQLNERRSRKLVERIASLQPKLVVVSDTTIAMLVPQLKALGLKVVLDLHNMDSVLYRAIAAAATDEPSRLWAEAASAAFESAETAFAPQADQLWVCSAEDAARFAGLMPRSRIAVIPNVYETQPLAPSPPSNVVAYVGQFNYLPNELAALALIQISHQLEQAGVRHRVDLIGRPNDVLRKAAASVRSVRLVGYVTDVAPVLADVSLMVLPITVGGGTRFKILEAMAMGRPVLSTSIGIEGLSAVNGVHAVIEDDLEQFPSHIAQLLADQTERDRLAGAAHTLVAEQFSPDALLAGMQKAIKRLSPRLSFTRGQEVAFGTRAVQQSAVTNRSSRLLMARFLVRSAVPPKAMQGNVLGAGKVVLPNSAVHVGAMRADGTMVEALAVVPRGASYQGLSLELLGWDQVIGRFPIEDVEEEDLGLIAVDQDLAGGRLNVLGWSGQGRVQIDAAGQRLSVDAGRGTGGRVFAASGALPGALARLPIQLEAEQRDVFVPDMRDWVLRKPATTARLHSLKDRHRGEVAWLIGNGPSVRMDDLAALRGRLSFAFNRFHLAHAQTPFRPTYTVSADRQMIEDFGQQIVEESDGTVFLANDVVPDTVGDYIWLRQVASYPPLFSMDPTIKVGAGGSSVFVAMQVAYFMGVRSFYIYGADFSFHFEHGNSRDKFRIATGDGNHFIKDYRAGRPWCPPSFKDICPSFALASKLMDAEGGFIRNVTRGGLLDIFDREDFDRAVAA